MHEKIAIIIVTYNRLIFLKQQISYFIQEPCYSRCSFFIIDNHSCDGTAEYLQTLCKEQPNFKVFRLAENTGGAGGFHEGVKLAYEAGFDWFWIMDDDVAPLSGALEVLLHYRNYADCIQTAKKDMDGNEIIFEGILDPATMRRKLIPLKALNGKEFADCNCATFEGLFFSRKLVDKIGYPDAQFFIGLDDLFYGYKASEVCRFIYVGQYTLLKLLDKSKISWKKRGFYTSTPFGRYFHLRNYWIILRYLRDRNKLTFAAYLTYHQEAVKALALTLIVERDWRGFKTVLRGIFDGYHNDMDAYKKIFFGKQS